MTEHALGYIRGAYGVRGWVRVMAFGDLDGALTQTETWTLIQKGQSQKVSVLDLKIQGEELLAHLKGCQTRQEAEALKGATIVIGREDFPQLEEDTFYWVDLIGLVCEDLQGHRIGQVKDMMDNGAQSILVIQRQRQEGEAWVDCLNEKGQKQTFLVPFVNAHVPQVCLKEGRLSLDWPLDF